MFKKYYPKFKFNEVNSVNDYITESSEKSEIIFSLKKLKD